jgi:hypothetical protein
MDIENEIITNDGENVFQIRFVKTEGIGLVTTKNGKNYLILDSSEYWYDIIQNGYPKIKKCPCKNEWFKLHFKYYYREHYNDIKNIEVKSFCKNCGKKSTLLNIDIKYSPTEHLINNPLVFCEKPNIKYNSKAISCILNINEFNKILLFLSELGFIFYCWYWNQMDKKRELKLFSMEQVQKCVDDFLNIYVSNSVINIDDIVLTTNELGIYIKDDLWRKKELIEIGCVIIMNVGKNYRLEYSTQFIDTNGEVKDKSKEFSEKIIEFEKWYNKNFKK